MGKYGQEAPQNSDGFYLQASSLFSSRLQVSRSVCHIFFGKKKKYFSSSSKQVEYAHLKRVFE